MFVYVLNYKKIQLDLGKVEMLIIHLSKIKAAKMQKLMNPHIKLTTFQKKKKSN